MASESYPTLDLASVQKELTRLHEQITASKQRIEIKRDGSDETCVMISKAELEGLERALQILADGDAYKAMSQTLNQLVADSNEQIVAG